LAVLRDNEVLTAIAHEGAADYSSWVLPRAHEALRAAGLEIRDVEVFAVASGPGSFTGVRVGLTSVKAWSEVYGRAIASVSRLEAIAAQAAGGCQYVAASVDAHRDQVFGGLYRSQEGGLRLVETEMVAAPAEFIGWVKQRTVNERVSWISMDPEKVRTQEAWRARADAGETVEMSTNVLAPVIGEIGYQRAKEGRLVDALALDADYVRRTDAETSWNRGRTVPGEIKNPRSACTVRRFGPGDATAVREIVKESPQAAAWAEDAYERLPEWGGPLALVSEHAGEVTGFLMGREVAEEAEVLNLAVMPKFRRLGHGAALVSTALEGMRSRGVQSVYLEVRESNTRAIAFYEKHGFGKTGRRKGYYREPDEAAVTMVKKLTG